jgi:multiple sugar transport system substrate-binding protein
MSVTPPLNFQLPACRPARCSRRAFLAAACGAVGLLAACSSVPAPGGVAAGTPTPPPVASPGRILGIFPAPPPPTPTPVPVVLRFAHWEAGAPGQVLAAIGEAFMQRHPQVVLRQEVTAFGSHFTLLQQSLAAGAPPDVFINSGAYLFPQLQAHALLDLAPQVAASGLDLTHYWSEPIFQSVDGQRFNLPVWSANELLFFNATHFAAAGLPTPTASWTWNDLRQAAQKLTVGQPGQVTRWGLLCVEDLVGGWGSFVAANGGGWLDPAQRKATLDAPATAEALQWLVDAITRDHLSPRPSEQQRLSQGGQVDLFLAGVVSMFPTGTWEMTAALDQAGFVWDVQPLPRGLRPGGRQTLASTQPASAAKITAQPELAGQLLQYLLAPESQQRWVTGKLRLPSLQSAATDPTAGYATPPPVHAASASAVMASAQDLQFVAGWNDFRAAVVAALLPAYEGTVPLTDAIQAALTAGNAALTAVAGASPGTPSPAPSANP